MSQTTGFAMAISLTACAFRTERTSAILHKAELTPNTQTELPMQIWPGLRHSMFAENATSRHIRAAASRRRGGVGGRTFPTTVQSISGYKVGVTYVFSTNL